METTKKNYLFLIAIHVVIGFFIYLLPFIGKIYSFAILLIGLYLIVKTGNRNQEVIYVCAYIVGVEVFLRMTGASPNYEFAKYGIVFFSFIGMIYSGFSKDATPYWIFLFLLIPSIFIAAAVLNDSTGDLAARKIIVFNISGPVSLGIVSIYMYKRRMTLRQMNKVLLTMGLPILSCAVYLLFYTPSIKSVLTGTGSNFGLSGGFGPNQVSTVMGLGMFIFISRLFLASKSWFINCINITIGVYICYRGMLTFSRGGMITGFAMVLALLFFIYLNTKNSGKVKLNYIIVLLGISMLVIWTITSFQTGGLIDKRYANKDAAGRVKEDKFTGRTDLAQGEIKMFLENPIFGVGVGKGTEIRNEEIGEVYASHDEITRMLAEHGSLGILALLILFITPFYLYIDNKQHVYLFSFFIFWLLTINHAAMRTAAPSFIYALTLLNVKFEQE